jgi:hypothetical protein
LFQRQCQRTTDQSDPDDCQFVDMKISHYV